MYPMMNANQSLREPLLNSNELRQGRGFQDTIVQILLGLGYISNIVMVVCLITDDNNIYESLHDLTIRCHEDDTLVEI